MPAPRKTTVILVSPKKFLDVGWVLKYLLRLCKFVIRLRPAAGVPAFKGLPRWDPVSDWPGFEAESVLWLRGLVWNLPSSSSL